MDPGQPVGSGADGSEPPHPWRGAPAPGEARAAGTPAGAGRAAPAGPPPAFFAALRDPGGAAAAKDAAWAEFVLWFHAEHWRPELEARLERRIEARGMGAHLAAGDVLTVFCFKVRERPEVLGEREVPSRAWLRQQLFHTCQDLEKPARREEQKRHRPGSPEALRALLEGETGGGLAGARAFSAAFLASPEVVVLMRELEAELGRQLARLRAENPGQHDAWVMGSAGTRYQEIGRLLGTTAGNVKSLVHRAREKLRERLRAYLGTGEGEP